MPKELEMPGLEERKQRTFCKAFLRWFFMWKLGGRCWHTTRQTISIDVKTFTIDGLLQEMVSLSPSGMFRQVLEASIRMVGLGDLEYLGQL